MSEFLKQMTKNDVVHIGNVQKAANAIKCLHNLCFPELSNSNDKFPGTMVSSIMKKDLHHLHGVTMAHVPYNDIEILSWKKPYNIYIPQIRYSNTKIFCNSSVANENIENNLTLDFCTEKDKKFFIYKPSLENISYGEKEFYIYK